MSSDTSILTLHSEAEFMEVIKSIPSGKGVSTITLTRMKEITKLYSSIKVDEARELFHRSINNGVQFPWKNWNNFRGHLKDGDYHIVDNKLMFEQKEVLPLEEYHSRAIALFRGIPGDAKFTLANLKNVVKPEMSRLFYLHVSLLDHLFPAEDSSEPPTMQPAPAPHQQNVVVQSLPPTEPPTMQTSPAPQQLPVVNIPQSTELVAAEIGNNTGVNFVVNDPNAINSLITAMAARCTNLTIVQNQHNTITTDNSTTDNSTITNSTITNNNSSSGSGNQVVLRELTSIKQGIEGLRQDVRELKSRLQSMSSRAQLQGSGSL